MQIEITPPKTIAQRRSIVMVHTKQMFDAGRLQVKDPPPGSAAADQLEVSNKNIVRVQWILSLLQLQYVSR